MTDTSAVSFPSRAETSGPAPPWSPDPSEGQGKGPSRQDDAALMESSRSGDVGAYTTLFQRHAARLLRAAFLLLHDEAAAEDAVQETFGRGLSSLPRYRGDAKPDVWLFAIALNVCRQHLRNVARRESSLDPLLLEPARVKGQILRGVLTSIIRREAGARLAIALGFLTEAQREVFVMHYVEGLPYRNVADLLDMSPGAVRSLAHRAKETLRAKIPRNIFPFRAT